MDYTLLMELVSRIGSRLATSGAETYRIEDSITRILGAYGVDSRVYSVPGSLFITMEIPGQLPVTQLCRLKSPGTDLDAVEQYNNLSRRICAAKPDPAEALQWVEETEKACKKYSIPMSLLGHMMVGGGFCVFFGGSLTQDLFCGIFCGFLIGFFSMLFEKVDSNAFFQKIALGFCAAFTAYGMAALGITDNVHAVVVGPLMLLVPGLMFTNAMRDIIFGDTNSGVNRIVTALLIAVAIAIGTAAAWNVSCFLWGAPAAVDIEHSNLISVISAFFACLGFVIVFNIHGYGNMLCAVGSVLNWVTYLVLFAMGVGSLTCCLVATVAAAIFAEVMARVRKYPAISYLVISVLPLIPGSSIYYTAHEAVMGNMDGFIFYGVETLSVAGAMAVGILLVSTSLRILNSRKRPAKVR